MTVAADSSSKSYEHEGVTYYLLSRLPVLIQRESGLVPRSGGFMLMGRNK